MSIDLQAWAEEHNMTSQLHNEYSFGLTATVEMDNNKCR